MSLTSKRARDIKLPDIIVEDIVHEAKNANSLAVSAFDYSPDLHDTEHVIIPKMTTITTSSIYINLEVPPYPAYDAGIVLYADNFDGVNEERTGFFFNHITSLT